MKPMHVKTLLVLLVTMALVVPTGSLRAEDPIVLGCPLSTAFLYGWDAERGFRLAVDEVNAAGGAAGCQIEMILRDTQVDPKVGVDAAKALVDLEGVQVLLGAVSSGVSMPWSSALRSR